jgi:hypothetical protein
VLSDSSEIIKFRKLVGQSGTYSDSYSWRKDVDPCSDETNISPD